MKRTFFSLFLVPVLIFALATGATAQSTTPLFRSASFDHLFTTSAAEQAWHQANLGYNPEGIESNVWSGYGSGRVPRNSEKTYAINNLGYYENGY